MRARRTELNTELGRVEKALEEVESLLVALRVADEQFAATGLKQA